MNLKILDHEGKRERRVNMSDVKTESDNLNLSHRIAVLIMYTLYEVVFFPPTSDSEEEQ